MTRPTYERRALDRAATRGVDLRLLQPAARRPAGQPALLLGRLPGRGAPGARRSLDAVEEGRDSCEDESGRVHRYNAAEGRPT